VAASAVPARPLFAPALVLAERRKAENWRVCAARRHLEMLLDGLRLVRVTR
jgi:hypothetical protein